jgi:hypothetical protein
MADIFNTHKSIKMPTHFLLIEGINGGAGCGEVVRKKLLC